MADSTPAFGWDSRQRVGAVCGVVFLVLAGWAGCTVTNENYPILSFFFDGVPDPNAPALPDGTTDLTLIRQSPTYTVHQPFAEERCVECHGRRFGLEAVEATACLHCHENIPSSQPYMHGPVVTVACLWCHAPHESPYAALFKGPVRQVCSACHVPGMLGTDQTPEHHPEAKESCLDCHFGHGGVSRFFLREYEEDASSFVSPHVAQDAVEGAVVSEDRARGFVETEPKP